MSQEISIKPIDASTYEVTVGGSTPTVHIVNVEPQYSNRLAGSADTETLVRVSFEFLLARESNTSILRRFDLPVIGNYFPEYEQEMRKLLR
ncbi:MAG TPA: hypothetical protein VEA39_06475 [Methylophilaceae bacterium]|nr:hypothetical protein [Methylophilaceae bacterium]